MVKLKEKQPVLRTANDGDNLNDLVNSSNALVDLNSFEEDDWVIVKKQRVNILIPPLPGTKQPTIDNTEPGQLQEELHGEIVNDTAELPTQNLSEVNQVVKNHESMTLSSMKNAQFASGVCSSVPVVEKPMEVEIWKSKMQGHNGACKPIHKKKLGTLKPHETCFGHRFWRTVEPPKRFCPRVNKMLRASILERKLARAGGLSRWLTSLGLEQFIRVFQRKNVSKFQLVNMSMEKLKDMGAHAVGPRRKLMHAIDCLCQPYCFQAL
ncbi:hypothetical protein Ancab_032370 [Ancistrocladus abbreviatus]